MAPAEALQRLKAWKSASAKLLYPMAADSTGRRLRQRTCKITHVDETTLVLLTIDSRPEIVRFDLCDATFEEPSGWSALEIILMDGRRPLLIQLEDIDDPGK
jgi:hypothetical protein